MSLCRDDVEIVFMYLRLVHYIQLLYFNLMKKNILKHFFDVFLGDRLLDIPCKVCGDRSSGKHYGIYSCDGKSDTF